MSGFWHLPLERPAIYAAVQRVFGGNGGAFDRSFRRRLADARGVVLDVGCGPDPDLPPSDGTLVGLDVNPHYILHYVATGARTWAGREVRGVVASAEALPFADRSFDECRCVATLHHVPDRVVSIAIREMARVLRPGGRLAVFDMVRPALASSPLGWLTCRLDRGRFVRTEGQLVDLARAASPGPWEVDAFWYSWIRLRGCVMMLRKS